MKIFELFKRPKRNTAQLAKERLQIIVSHESARRTGPEVIRKMQHEILEVICRYVHIDQDKIKVQLERHGDQSVLELNVTLPDGKLMQLSTPTEATEEEVETATEKVSEEAAESPAPSSNPEATSAKTDTTTKNQANKKKQTPKNTEQAEA